MTKLLGSYQNGNYQVFLYEDGTKIRKNDLDFFDAAFPESIDLKITNACDRGCSMCHENSVPNGKHADLASLMPLLDAIQPYTELAIGGGNPLSHPDLLTFLRRLRERNIIANLTVHHDHFMNNIPLLVDFTERKLIRGLGVSYPNMDAVSTKAFVQQLRHFPNAVVHVINGIVTPDHLLMLSNEGLKLLILGYKRFRRGVSHYEKLTEETEMLMAELYRMLPVFVENECFEAVCFDNLAVAQLNPSRLLSQEEWSQCYLGDDGRDGALTSASMYIDAVKREFAVNSCSEDRYPLTDNIEEMFQQLKEVYQQK